MVQCCDAGKAYDGVCSCSFVHDTHTVHYTIASSDAAWYAIDSVQRLGIPVGSLQWYVGVVSCCYYCVMRYGITLLLPSLELEYLHSCSISHLARPSLTCSRCMPTRLAADGKLAEPQFWLRAIKALDSAVDLVAKRDEAPLAALADVRLRWDWATMPTRDSPSRDATGEVLGWASSVVPDVLRKALCLHVGLNLSCVYCSAVHGALCFYIGLNLGCSVAFFSWMPVPFQCLPAVEFEFLDNPYFGPCTLRKRYTFACAEGSAHQLGLEATGQVQGEVPWGAEGKRDPTTRPGPNGKLRPAASFFNLFKKGGSALERCGGCYSHLFDQQLKRGTITCKG